MANFELKWPPEYTCKRDVSQEGLIEQEELVEIELISNKKIKKSVDKDRES